MRQLGGYQGVPGFVIGGDFLLVIGQQHRLALGAHEHLVLGNLKVVHQDDLAVLAGSVKRGFVDHVREVGAGEARCAARKHGEIDIVSQGNLAAVNPQDLFAATNVRTRDHHAAVETAGAQQRRVEYVRPVGSGDEDNAFVRFEAVHLDEQLVQGLLTFIVTTAQTGATMAADGVDFIDEDDAGGILLALFEEVADTACADADEHLDEVRTGNAEEGNVGFAGDRAGEQGLAGARRSDEQHALGDASAELLEFLGFAQELDDLAQLFLGLIHPGDVFERHLFLVHGEQAGAALAERQGLVATSLHLANHEEPQGTEQDERRKVQQPTGPAVALAVLHRDIDAFITEFLVHVVVIRRNRGMEPAVAFLVLAVNLRAVDGDRSHLGVVHLVKELREIDVGFLHARGTGLQHLP